MNKCLAKFFLLFWPWNNFTFSSFIEEWNVYESWGLPFQMKDCFLGKVFIVFSLNWWFEAAAESFVKQKVSVVNLGWLKFLWMITVKTDDKCCSQKWNFARLWMFYTALTSILIHSYIVTMRTLCRCKKLGKEQIFNTKITIPIVAQEKMIKVVQKNEEKRQKNVTWRKLSLSCTCILHLDRRSWITGQQLSVLRLKKSINWARCRRRSIWTCLFYIEHGFWFCY